MWKHNKKYKYTYDMRVDTLPSGRTYFTPDGDYPSITTVLGKTANNVWLQAWKDKVGEENFKDNKIYSHNNKCYQLKKNIHKCN